MIFWRCICGFFCPLRDDDCAHCGRRNPMREDDDE